MSPSESMPPKQMSPPPVRIYQNLVCVSVCARAICELGGVLGGSCLPSILLYRNKENEMRELFQERMNGAGRERMHVCEVVVL